MRWLIFCFTFKLVSVKTKNRVTSKLSLVLLFRKIWQGTVISWCLTPSTFVNGSRRNRLLGLLLRWTSSWNMPNPSMLHGNRDKLKSNGTLGTYAVFTLLYLSSFSLLKIEVWVIKNEHLCFLSKLISNYCNCYNSQSGLPVQVFLMFLEILVHP